MRSKLLVIDTQTVSLSGRELRTENVVEFVVLIYGSCVLNHVESKFEVPKNSNLSPYLRSRLPSVDQLTNDLPGQFCSEGENYYVIQFTFLARCHHLPTLCRMFPHVTPC